MSPNETDEIWRVMDLTTKFPIQYAVILNGYLSPVIIALTVVTNTFVINVLLQKHMRSTTNAILVSIAVSDMLTGVFPLPTFVYFFGFEHFKDYVQYEWCRAYKYISEVLPTIFHTVSIWLTMALAIQRYIYICHSMKARTWSPCTIPKVIFGILAIYIIAILSQVPRFFDSHFVPIEMSSKINRNSTVTACLNLLQPWVLDNVDVYFNIYYWFRVICIHIIPCTFLFVLNSLIVYQVRTSEFRRRQFLNQKRQTESKNIKESNSITLMLVAVVGIFIMVELPQGICLMIHAIDITLDLSIFTDETYQTINIVSNFIILLSYPLNFFIYCGMSRQFRETFKSMFTGRNRAHRI